MTTQPFPVPALLLAALTSLGSAGALAQSRASEAPNFEVGAIGKDIDTSGSTSNGTVGVTAAGTIPIGSLFAASLSAGYSNSNVRTREVLAYAGDPTQTDRVSCSFDSTDGSVTLFARRPSLGRVGVSYGLGRLSSSCGDDSVFVATGDKTLRTHNYSIDAEIYLRDFTLAASRTSTDLDGGPKLESTSLTASWYALDSLRVSVSGNDLYDQNTYGIMLEHQPEFLGNALGVHLGYAATEQSERTGTISLGISYYFGTHVDLKVRDRQYR